MKKKLKKESQMEDSEEDSKDSREDSQDENSGSVQNKRKHKRLEPELETRFGCITETNLPLIFNLSKKTESMVEEQWFSRFVIILILGNTLVLSSEFYD
jgi:hypothetical protein